MRVERNVLDMGLFNKVVDHAKRNFAQNKHIYADNRDLWQVNLVQNLSGPCWVTEVEENWSVVLEQKLSKYFPSYSKLNMMWYVWQKGSGINWHTDFPHKFTASLYLTSSVREDGGTLIWQDHDDYSIHGFMAKQNCMSINVKNEHHMVTPVGQSKERDRYTIQIFGQF